MGANKKVTIMVLKVDLQCAKCYRKVKKVLCKFPQIRDQMYDEKNNQVIIKVVCCSPEKIRDKLCCKGCGVIKSIDIIGPPPVKPPPETVKPPPPPETVKPPPPPETVKPPPPPKTVKPPPPETVKPPPPPETVKPPPPPETVKPPPPPETVKPPPPPETVKPPPPEIPPVKCPQPPVNTCCTECYGGHPGGPCQTGYGYGMPDPYIQYDGYCGRPVYDSYGGWRSYNTGSYCVIRPDCFSEENPQACTIM